MARCIKIGIVVLLLSFSAKAQLISDLHTLHVPMYCHPMLDTMAYKTPFGAVSPGVKYGMSVNPVWIDYPRPAVSPGVKYGMSVGTSVGLFGGGVGLTNAYIAPQISYAPSEKLQVIGGIAVARAALIGAAQPNVLGQSAPMPTSTTPLQAWAYAQYSLNHKLQVYATGAVDSNQPCYVPCGGGLGVYNAQMFGVGLNYSISPRATLGVQVSVERSDAPLLRHRNARGMGGLWGW